MDGSFLPTRLGTRVSKAHEDVPEDNRVMRSHWWQRSPGTMVGMVAMGDLLILGSPWLWNSIWGAAQ